MKTKFWYNLCNVAKIIFRWNFVTLCIGEKSSPVNYARLHYKKLAKGNQIKSKVSGNKGNNKDQNTN